MPDHYSHSPYAEQMKSTEYKRCKREVDGSETCDEIIQKYVTEEPASEWEQMSPQPAAYAKKQTGAQAEAPALQEKLQSLFSADP